MDDNKTYGAAIKLATCEILKDPKSLLIGQGVDDFKGLWGTTTGLKELYPQRVFDTPLSEETVAGICLGSSLNGMYPINTHIRADFALLMFNQLINMGSKYSYMFGGLFKMPSIFRLVIGRSWGQGAQHSQSFQSMLGHIPGLRVFMPATFDDIINTYMYAFNELKCPTVIFEHRLLYDLKFKDGFIGKDILSSYKKPETKIERAGKDVTIVATSVMVVEALRAAEYLSEFGVELEVINYNDITFPNIGLILESVIKTGRLIVSDTSWVNYGVGAEVIARVVDQSLEAFKAPPIRLGTAFTPCPTAKSLEDEFYSGFYEIIEAVKKLIGKNRGDNILLPDKSSTTAFYKNFKGPF